MINTASGAKLYPELNLIEEILCDGIMYHYALTLLTFKVDYFYSRHDFQRTIKKTNI
jgi:hypothetical protein